MNLEPSSQLNLHVIGKYVLDLSKLYLNNKLPNKMLLSCEKGIGKSTLAYHLINFILSQDEEFSYDIQNLKIDPENRSFKLLQNKSSSNFILVDVNEEKKMIDINQIRNMILNLNKSSFNNKARLVLIDNIELLNINAVNALLKILEEPNDNINFILINNNKKILPTLKSRCLNFKIQLTTNQVFDITNKILKDNYIKLINNEILNIYNTPGEILKLIDFARNNEIDLKQISLVQLINKIIMDKNYKRDSYTKQLIYSLIEIYFRNNISINNIQLINLYHYFLKKINYTKIYNLDEESLFMEFEDRVLNG